MIYYCYGINHQIAIDVRRWARAELVNAVIRHLQSDPPQGYIRLPTTYVSEENLDGDLKSLYGIEYLAPYDATQTNLAAESIDVITTTSVLEHVPEDIIRKIFKEYARIFRKNGFMRHVQ
jgi:Methyltransferase domain